MKLKQLPITLLFAILLFTNCEKSSDDILSNININKNLGFIDYSLMVEFVNASNPNQPPSNIKMTVEGPGADNILESAGEKIFKVINGKIYLILNPNAKPTSSNSIDFTIKATADGYLPVNYQAHINFDQKEQVVSIPMVNLSSPPVGVANTTSTFTLNAGSLTTTQNVVVKPTGDKITGATVEIPAGTSFYDLDGNSLSGTDLKVSLTHFDAQGEAALASFPGGFSPDKLIGESGKAESVFFATAGFSSIDMSVAGKAVKGFSQPIHVSMSVSSLTNNLDTNKGIVAGDKIPIWSYDVDSGVWQYEQSGTVVLKNGELSVDFDVTHLTWYNLDFYGLSCPMYTVTYIPRTYYWTSWWNNKRYSWTYYEFVYRYTPPTGKIKIVSNNPSYEGRYGEVVLANNNQLISGKIFDVKNGSEIQFYNAPQQACKFRVYSGTSYYNKGTLIAETAAFNPCSSQITLNVPLPAPIKLSLKSSCFNNTKTFVPSFYVDYKPQGQPYYSYLTYVNNGIASTTLLEIGKTYDFRIYYFGKVINFTKTVTSADNVFNFDLDNDTCSKIFAR